MEKASCPPGQSGPQTIQTELPFPVLTNIHDFFFGLFFCLFAFALLSYVAAAMASGFGVTGKKGRCYDVWMDFSDCMSHCTMPAECTSRRDDYFECLHHRKEYSRMNAINKEKERQAFGDKNGKPKDSEGGHH